MGRLLIAIVIGFIVASLCDWLFMGVLFHERYKSYPEVWRDTGNERAKIAVAQIYCAMTAAGYVLLASFVGPLRLGPALAVAVLIWIIGPFPLLLGNHLFIKIDPRVTATHAVGWLVKLMLIAAITAMIL